MSKIFTISLVVAILTAQFSFAQDAPVGKKGTLAGKVVDKKTSEEIIGATVQIEGTTIATATDIDGKFFMKVDPGTYTILISYVSYSTKKIEGVVITSGELTNQNVAMEEDSKQLEEVVVVGEAKKESAAGLLLQQKNAVAVSSGVSAELIRKLPDRTTADIIKRVSGATIQDGKFAIIRGMQDRYNYGLINGAPLPSSEPDRKAFSLDLVPAQVVDNMQIFKTATPDMPGDFAGGLIQINTKDIPDENTFFVNVGGGYHSITTFKDFYKSPQSGGSDFLGIGNSARLLPSDVAQSSDAVNRSIFNDATSIVNDTKKFNNDFTPTKTSAMPNLSLQIGGSSRIKVFGNDLGVIGAITYNNSNLYEPYDRNSPAGIDSSNRFNYARTDSTIGTFYKYDRYRNTINTGYLLNFTYKIGQNNKLFYKNLLTYVANDQAIPRSQQAYNPQFPQPYYNDKDIAYFYQNNRSYFSQLGGEHLLAEKSKIKLNWVAGLTSLDMQSPDFKRNFSRAEGTTRKSADTSTQRVLNGIPASPGSPNNPGRYFFGLQETGTSLNIDVNIPVNVIRTNIKVGGMYHARNRDFNGRNFNLTNGSFEGRFRGNLQKDLYTGFINNIADTLFYQIESTQRQDKYGASSTLMAAFLMGETKITPSLRAIYGVRLETYNQKISSGFGSLTSVTSDNFKKIVDTTWTDVLPSLNVIYAINEKMNLRLCGSRTLSRPEFREFAPLAFFDFTRNAIFVGNPTLTRGKIDNLDIKFEYFMKPGSFVSFNPFLKIFTDPIENLIQPSQGYAQITFVNAKGAINYGVEFDARYQFSETGSEALNNFTLFGNLAVIYSNVNQDNLRELGLINKSVSSRPLQGQSPYVLNLGMQYQTPSEWSFTLAANTFGKRIVFVAPQDEFLVYESPRWVIDGSISKTFAKKWNGKVTMGDILAQNLIYYYDFNKDGAYTQGKDETFENYRRGYSIGLSLGYSF
ncbi:MAG: carboxypeptidase-like regulatory domain-containing protein [Cytophagales bacterium]|nr:carboxypeptidase-like regulatory domain-containing protein [Cytophagales bacterium]